ncbi:MAG: ABC transporter permease [Lachnospiraceae bacterium]|jgi:peptide/nickel transport system permease protein|nr:ABC transporter permease [Lachnospiraceae bacterium]
MIRREKDINLIIGGVICAVLLSVMAIGLFVTPHDPNTMNAATRFAGASGTHLLGCDNFGRDTLSRVMVGSQTTLMVAVLTVFFGATLGIVMGALTGYFGGVVDEVLMRINDALFAFPVILMVLVFVSVIGSGRSTIIIAIGIAFVPSFARIVRSEVVKQRELDYVIAARLSGAGDGRIIFVHILPNTLSTLLPALIIGFNNAILAETGMSYLGIGVQPPDPSLGRMLAEAQTYLFRAPLMTLVPGLTLILLILGFSLLSDGVTNLTKR